MNAITARVPGKNAFAPAVLVIPLGVAGTAALAIIVARIALGIPATPNSGLLYSSIFGISGVLCVLRVVLIRAERSAWTWFAVSMGFWTAAQLYATQVLARLKVAPYPSGADALWIAAYLTTFFGALALMRVRLPTFRRTMWVDAVLGGLAMSTVAAAVVVGPVLSSTGGRLAAVATNLVYPLVDILVVTIVLAVAIITGGRPGRGWMLLGAVFAAQAVSDTFYLYNTTSNQPASAKLIDATWPLYALAIAFAAWQKAPRAKTGTKVQGWPALALSSSFACVGLGVTTFDHWSRVSDVATILATTTLVAAIVRTAMTFANMRSRDIRLLAQSRDLLERNELILNAAGEGICGFDQHGVITFANPAAARLTGWDLGELEGRNFQATLHHAAPDVYCRKDGTVFPVELTSTPAGDVSDGVVVFKDVTARRRTETALERAHTLSLEASRAKSEFLTNMSHEIRTPLNGVVGMAELLMHTRLDAEQREYAEMVSASAEALLSVVNDILDFSKIEAGKLALDPHPFDLRLVVDDVWSILATAAHDKNLELIAWVDEALPDSLVGDSVRVQQVLTNLAANAIKFTASGDVVLRVTPRPLDDGSLGIHFAISDTGIGIEANAVDRIFDPFAQADTSTTRRFGGTGLGLSICHTLVGLMGGTIGVTSEPGTGSTFWFMIPFIAVSSGKTTPRPDFHGQRVLLVDDYATSRVIFDEQLRAWNLACDTAADRVTALQMVTDAAKDGRPYALVALDLHDQRGDGVALAEAIKAKPTLQATRLLMLSAVGADRNAAITAGIEGFLTKPVRYTRLRDETTRLLARGDITVLPGNPQPRAVQPTRLGGPLRVLLAEDNKVNQLVAVRMLEASGYEVDIAANGREAVQMHEAHNYDLIFMDCQMPELDGYSATAHIRAREADDHHTPIVAMTANALVGDRARCLAAGMDDYLSKPLRAADLEAAIGRAASACATPREELMTGDPSQIKCPQTG